MENSRLRAYAQAENDFADAYADLLNNYRLEKKAEQDSIYNDAMTTIDSQTWNTTADLENYVKGFEGKVSDTQFGELQNRLKFYQGDSKQQAADEEYKKSKAGIVENSEVAMTGYLDNVYAGNNFEIGGYNVELGDAESDQEFIDAAKSIPNKVPFTANGKVYIKLNGTVYKVRNKAGNSDTGKNIDKIVAALTGNTATE